MVHYPWDVCQQAVILAVMKGMCKLFRQTNKQRKKETNKTKTISDIMYTKTELNEQVHGQYLFIAHAVSDRNQRR